MYHFELWFSLDIWLGVELDHIVDHVIVLFLGFKGASILFSVVVVPSYIPPTVEEGSLFSAPCPALAFCRLFDDGQKFNTQGF